MIKKPYSIRIDPILLEQLKVQAEKEMRPVNNLIEFALNEYLKTKTSKSSNN